MNYVLIAGKEEGFAFKDGEIIGCGDEFDVEAMINSLRASGYKIFIVSKVTERIDDIIGEVAAE